ncbi:MAG: FAD-binding protein [Proteobacteria bacterium]|nr:FAD-binding protein [Pseudomonadota bacterium]
MISALTEADVIDAVRAARAMNRTLEITGAGTKRAYGRPMFCDDVLNVSTLSGIVKYEAAELLLTVLPGTPVAEITALLESKNQRLGFEPADWGPLLGTPIGNATIGGVLSADVNGAAAIRYGRARDSLLGVRAVNGMGEAYKAGGKVVKNVTGFDLPKLICGALGTLGVLTEVTLRVYPKPAQSVSIIVRDVNVEDGFALLRRVWQSPLEATALAYIPASLPLAQLGYVGEGAALIRLEGAHEPLKEKIAALLAIAPAAQQIEASSFFEAISSGAIFAEQSCDLWRISVPPSEAAGIVRHMGSPLFAADWAGRFIWIGLEAGGNGAELRALCECAGGQATLVKADKETRQRVAPFSPESPARRAVTKAVKAAFDPQNIFNPGRMWKAV